MRNVGIELRAINNLIMREMEKRSRDSAMDAVTCTNAWIIDYILQQGDRDVYQHELEDEFSITRSTASKVVNLMERKGLVKRLTAEHDARQRKLRLTPDALELAGNMRHESENLTALLLDGFSEGDIDTLFDYMERMKRNLRKEGD